MASRAEITTKFATAYAKAGKKGRSDRRRARTGRSDDYAADWLPFRSK